MKKLIFIIWTFVVTCKGILYIERYTVIPTTMLVWTVNYTHDFTGNSITNATVETFVTFKKALVYITIKAAENEHDREYKNTLVKTVADVEKTVKNSQSNLVLKLFIGRILQFMDFEVKFPFHPVILN